MHNFITSSVAKRTLRNLSHFYVAVRGEGPRAAEAKIQGRNVHPAILGFPDSSVGKESTCNAGDMV